METRVNLIMKWYDDYAKNFKDQISYQEEKAREILDRNYDLLYDFFCDVMERKVKYKIFKARRCQVLFQIFMPIILKNEQDIHIYGEFISDHAIARCKEEIIASSAVILDDILIHGRGLQDVYEELDASYENQNIHVYVHKMNKEADSMNRKLKAKLEFDSSIFGWEWRELSTQLVNVIQATATPYISTMATYISKRGLNLQKADEFFAIFDNANADHKRVGTTSLVLFEHDPLPELFQAWGYDACIRCYANEEMEKTAYVPYIFFKPSSYVDIESFCEKTSAHLNDKFIALKEELLLKADNKEKLKYKAYLVNTLLNWMYGLYLNNRYPGIFDLSFSNIPATATCVGVAVAHDMEKLQYEDIWGLLDTDLGKRSCAPLIEEDEELLEGLRQASSCETEDKILPLYFYYNRQIDEKSAKEKERRRKGLSTKAFYDNLKEDLHPKSCMQLKSWDSGIAACDKVVIKDEIVYSCVKAGEQSFRYILEAMKEEDSGRDQAVETAEQNQQENLKQRMLRKFMEVNSSRLCEWNVPLISQ